MQVIDVHSHFYPKAYLSILEKRNTWPIMSFDEKGRTIIVDRRGRIVTITEPMFNLEMRIRDMERLGVSMQCLSLSAPWTYFAKPEEEVKIAKMVNDEIARAVEKYPDRFIGLATLPLSDIDMAIEEAKRAIKDLGLKGIIMGTNINGETLDSPRLRPVFEVISSLKVPILLHPATPLCVEYMSEYRLAPMVGFPFETTMAVARLIFSGILSRLDTLSIIAVHGGGAIPYLAGRMEICYKAYPECREHINDQPMKYLTMIYYDTVLYSLPALKCLYETVGSRRMLFGSDYPHVIGDPLWVKKTINELKASDEEKQAILRENASKLFNVQL